MQAKSRHDHNCLLSHMSRRECGGVVVEPWIPNREVMGLIPTGVIVLCP